MIPYLTQFFTFRNLFNWRPAPVGNRGLIILIFIFGVFLVLAILSKIFQKKNENDQLLAKGWQKFFYLFLTMGLIGFCYLGFAYEGIPYFSAKIVLLIISLIFLIWLFFAAKYSLFTVPKIKKEIKKQKEFGRYLP